MKDAAVREHDKFHPDMFYARVLSNYDMNTGTQTFQRTGVDDSVSEFTGVPYYLWHMSPHTESINFEGQTEGGNPTACVDSKGVAFDFSHEHDVKGSINMTTSSQLPQIGEIVLCMVSDYKVYILDLVHVANAE
jgi:hypothetical protein